MTRTLYIKTFGCQMNEYDSAKMADVLAAAHGLTRVDQPEHADVLLLNTCSVREKAAEKVFSLLGQWRLLKQARPQVVIGVGGCVASQEGAAILKRAPYVDLVFGPQTLHRLPEMLGTERREHRPAVDISFPEIEKFDRLPEPRADGPSAFVSIMEGCSKYCSFCVVPYTRGEEWSRPFDDVIAETAALAGQGVHEVTLLGQNVNAYRGALFEGGTADLATLIAYIAAIDGIERIRYTTSHPKEMNDALIALYAEEPKLASHLHLPVQSGSDRVLAQMKRGYTTADFLSIVERLRAARPGIAIGSDFIVGFPGETDQDFDATLALVDAVRFDHSYSFLYSPRPGTPAAALPDDVPETVKRARLHELQRRLEIHAARYARAEVGTLQRVLVQGPARKGSGILTARNDSNRAVNFPGDAVLIGQFVAVQIEEAMPNSLRASLAAAPRLAAHHPTALSRAALY